MNWKMSCYCSWISVRANEIRNSTDSTWELFCPKSYFLGLTPCFAQFTESAGQWEHQGLWATKNDFGMKKIRAFRQDLVWSNDRRKKHEGRFQKSDHYKNSQKWCFAKQRHCNYQHPSIHVHQ